jgi:outer membrane scaffolding protein for murein synthesis (MipA/OmpV family)
MRHCTARPCDIVRGADALLRRRETATGGAIQYGYPFELGMATVTPNVGATWMSEDMASDYYGTLEEEVARGVVDYKLDALAIPHIGVSFFRPLGEKWFVMGNVKYSSPAGRDQEEPVRRARHQRHGIAVHRLLAPVLSGPTRRR